MESHNKSKVFFIMSKSENAFNKDPLELETGSDYQGENYEGMENIKASEFGAQDDDYFEKNIKTFDDQEASLILML